MNKLSNKDFIVYVGNFDISNLNAAGKRVLNISKLLKKMGYKVVLIESTRKNGKKNKSIIDNDIELYSMDYPRNIFGWMHYKKRYNEVVNILDNYNIKYMFFYGAPTISLFVSKMLKYNKINEIISISDIVDWLKVKFKNPFVKLIKEIDNFYKRYLNKKMDGLIVISTYLQNYYKKCETVLIPPLMEFNNSSFVNKSSDSNIKKIYYAGSPFKKGRKNIKSNNLKDRIDIIVDLLMNSNNNFYLDIYGITKEDFLNAFPRFKDKLLNNINFLGIVSNDLIVEKISDYDFSILFRNNSREANAGFSTKIAESLSLFVPIITNDTSDIKKYIKNGKNGFIIDIFDEEKALNQLNSILNLASNDINEMKKYCRNNQVFDLNNYENDVKKFLIKLNNN